jgi:hypothetical protein
MLKMGVGETDAVKISSFGISAKRRSGFEMGLKEDSFRGKPRKPSIVPLGRRVSPRISDSFWLQV